MSNTKFTPGPWKTLISGHGFSIEDNNGYQLCYSNNVSGRHNENLANAKLIAAAPEMLELLQWISRATNSPEIGIRCDRLIKKATE